MRENTIFRTSPGKFRDIFGTFPEISREIPENMREHSGTFPAKFLDMSRKCSGTFRNKSETDTDFCLEFYQDMSGIVPELFRNISGKKMEQQLITFVWVLKHRCCTKEGFPVNLIATRASPDPGVSFHIQGSWIFMVFSYG